MLRADRADVGAQLVALADARSSWSAAVAGLRAASTGPDLDDVRQSCRDLERVLNARGKRPPLPDASDLFGAVSAALRVAARSDEWDAAVEAVRDAESTHDHARDNLATARGEDGA